MDDATATDNCSEVSITVKRDPAGDAAGNYTIVRTFYDGRLWQQRICEPDDQLKTRQLLS